MFVNIKKRIHWFLSRHPIWYYIRFALLCKNHRGSDDALPVFNDRNRKQDVHPLFYEVSSRIAFAENASTFEKAVAISIWLRRNIKGGRGLGLSSHRALELMVDGKGGICSDFSQVYNVFCLIHDIRVREWGSVEKFYNARYGHTFNEFFDPESGRWIAIDVKKNILFENQAGTLLSAIELFTNVRDGVPYQCRFLSDYRCPKMDKIGKTYGPQTIAFVIGNYDNKVYDDYLNRFRKLPVFAVNGMLILLRKNYQYIFALDNYRSKLFPAKKNA
jgi:hypothetical protein